MKYIAYRELICSHKKTHVTKKIIVKISEPYTATQDQVDFPVDGIISGCHVEIDGIEEAGADFFGMDSLQAINIASNIDPYLERLRNKFEFFWLNGDAYFDE